MKYLKLLFLLLVTNYCSAQTPQVIAFGASGKVAHGSNGIIDSQGDYMFDYTYSSNNRTASGISFFNAAYQHKWSLRIGDTSDVYKIREFNNGNYLVLCWLGANSLRGNSLLVNFDRNGQVLFGKYVTTNLIYNDFDIDAEGNIYLVGRYYDGIGGVVLSKLDQSGNHLWTKTYLNTVTQRISRADALFVRGNEIYLTGSAEKSYYSPRNTFVVKTDLNGSLKWGKDYGHLTQHIFITNITSAPNNGVLLSGSISDTASSTYISSSDGLLIRTDSNGVLMNSMSYGNSESDAIYAALQDNNNGFKVIGATKPIANCGSNLMTISVDNNLMINYHKLYGTASGSGAIFSDFGYNGNGYYAYGHGTLFSYFNNGADVECLKFDTALNLPCRSYVDTLGHSPVSLSSVTGFVSNTISATLVNYNKFQSDTLFSANVCQGIPLINETVAGTNLKLMIYPNPNSGTFHIETEANISHMEIYSIKGEKVMEIENYYANKEIVLNSKGLYILNITLANGRRVVRKILVE